MITKYIFQIPPPNLHPISLHHPLPSFPNPSLSPDYRTVEPKDGDGQPTDPTSQLPGIPTSVVNGTAPQPRVLLRIVNEQGQDIQGTKLGEPLFLRIELDGDSIFDIFARNLVAQSGLDDEEILLLDDRGCPTDPVFPGLTKDPETGALLGRFEAFKFSDTTVVNFEVNVQFCQDACNPVMSLSCRIYEPTVL